MRNLVHTFVVITAGEGKPGHYDFKSLFSTRNDAEVAELSQLLLERDAGFRRDSFARNVRAVRVIHVDPAEHEKNLTTPGRNGLKSRPIKRGQLFKSASAASGHLGLRHNEVAIALSRCAQTEQPQATLRGVTFAYADTLKDS